MRINIRRISAMILRSVTFQAVVRPTVSVAALIDSEAKRAVSRREHDVEKTRHSPQAVALPCAPEQVTAVSVLTTEVSRLYALEHHTATAVIWIAGPARGATLKCCAAERPLALRLPKVHEPSPGPKCCSLTLNRLN